MANLSIS